MSTQPLTFPLSGQMRAMHSVCQMLAQISPSMYSSCSRKHTQQANSHMAPSQPRACGAEYSRYLLLLLLVMVRRQDNAVRQQFAITQAPPLHPSSTHKLTSFRYPMRVSPSVTVTDRTVLKSWAGSTHTSLELPSDSTSSLPAVVMPQPSFRGVLNVPT